MNWQGCPHLSAISPDQLAGCLLPPLPLLMSFPWRASKKKMGVLLSSSSSTRATEDHICRARGDDHSCNSVPNWSHDHECPLPLIFLLWCFICGINILGKGRMVRAGRFYSLNPLQFSCRKVDLPSSHPVGLTRHSGTLYNCLSKLSGQGQMCVTTGFAVRILVKWCIPGEPVLGKWPV